MGADQHRKVNGLFWLLAAALVSAGIVANSYFGEVALPLRLAGWIVLACVFIAIIFQTTQGKKFWGFAKEARIELRKVVWPSRQETVKTTMVIAGLVVVMALILWGVDSVLLWAVGLLTG